MTNGMDGERNGCTFQWKIENISQWWWLKEGEKILSPTFIADAVKGTKWSLQLSPVVEICSETYIGVYLHREEDCGGPTVIKVNVLIVFLGRGGSFIIGETNSHLFLRDANQILPALGKKERIFVTEKKQFLPEDTLTVQCTVWSADEVSAYSNHIFAATVIKVKRRAFLCRIDKICTLESRIINKFNDSLICFHVILNEGFDGLEMDMTSLDDSIKYISCNTSIIDSEDEKKNCGIKKYFASDLKKGKTSFTVFFPKMVLENKSRYFPNDVLFLYFEFVISSLEHSEYRKKASKLKNTVVEKEKFPNTTVLTESMKSLLNDGVFSDTELRTPTKTFSVHKGILSVRSPVFRSMFMNDMKEKNSGYVDITDFEDDTVHRMLLYIYTDSLEDLQFESVSKLHTIANKYEIPDLKSRCSSFLEESLCPTNACDTLVLADLNNDEDLKSSVYDYILRQRKQVFCSEEWKDFMNTHLKLAADLMYRKITNT